MTGVEIKFNRNMKGGMHFEKMSATSGIISEGNYKILKDNKNNGQSNIKKQIIMTSSQNGINGQSNVVINNRLNQSPKTQIINNGNLSRLSNQKSASNILIKKRESNQSNESPMSLNINNDINQQMKIGNIVFNSKIKTASKFQLQIHCDSTSKLYDNIYFKKKQRNLIKDSTENYCIRNNNVIFHEFQKFNFEVYNPFSIKERFFNINVNQCFIHIKIKNVTDNILTINDLGINLKEKTDKVKSVKNIDDKIKLLKSGNDKIKLVKSLEEIKNLGHKNENDSKYISLQPKEELMALFKIEDPDIFYEKSDYILYISWLKKFDFDSKLFLYDFSYIKYIY